MALAEKFECNTRMTEKTAWQDEKGFTLDVPVNLQNEWVHGKGKKADVPDENKLWFPLQSLDTTKRNRLLWMKMVLK